MMQILYWFLQNDVFTVTLRIVLAAVLGGIIGNERGRHGSPAGLRTHILVCLGATMTSLIGTYAVNFLGYNGDPFRIAAQVVSGIGFLGAGMIIVKNGNTITGLTTAAGMWTTATIGIALGVGFYSGAIIMALVCVFVAAVLTRMERNRKKTTQIYLEVEDLSTVEAVTDQIRELLHHDAMIEIIPAKSGTSGTLGVYIVTSKIEDIPAFREEIHALGAISFVIIE